MELYARSWNCIPALGTVCKVIEMPVISWNCMQPRVTLVSMRLCSQKLIRTTTGSSFWKSWIQPSVLETFYDILKLSLVLDLSVGWALLLLGKKFDISAQFDYIEWVFWSLLFLQNLRFYGFSVFLKNSFLFQMRINDQI